MLVEYATLWLLTLPLSPATCVYYLLLISGVPTLALASDIVFFFYRVHNVVSSIHRCMHV